MRCTMRFSWPWEVDISPSSNGGWHSKWLASIDKKPVSSEDCHRLPRQACGRLRGEAESEDSYPRVEFPYMYPMAWYVMHCPSLMTVFSPSEGFVPFAQKLESSNWSQYYMFYVQKALLSSSNYQLDQCFLDISDASYGDKFTDLADLNEFP